MPADSHLAKEYQEDKTIFTIDPGTFESAFCEWNSQEGLVTHGIIPNGEMLNILDHAYADRFGIEMVASYGMPVGREVFETCVWIGRFIERWKGKSDLVEPLLIYRRDIKIHHCGSMKAKDKNIAQALKDKYGEVGTLKNPGPLYGVKSHIWSALAVATFILEKKI